MKNLGKCTRCNAVSIDEEYTNHECLPQIKDIKKIKVAEYYFSKNRQNHQILEVLTLDGIHYEFDIIPEDKEKTRISYQPEGNTENINSQGNSTENSF